MSGSAAGFCPPEAFPVATVDDDVRHREKSGLKADVEVPAEFDP